MGMSPDADIGWGVQLGSDSGEGRHESVEDVDLYGFLNHPQIKDSLELRFAGHVDYSYPVIFIKRTHTYANWGHEEVDPKTLSNPTVAEQFLLLGFLKDIGFTGDNTVKLLVVASYG